MCVYESVVVVFFCWRLFLCVVVVCCCWRLLLAVVVVGCCCRLLLLAVVVVGRCCCCCLNWRDRNNVLTKLARSLSNVVVVGSCDEPFRGERNPDDGIQNPDTGEKWTPLQETV